MMVIVVNVGKEKKGDDWLCKLNGSLKMIKNIANINSSATQYQSFQYPLWLDSNFEEQFILSWTFILCFR